jgi:hypothetical protein
MQARSLGSQKPSIGPGSQSPATRILSSIPAIRCSSILKHQVFHLIRSALLGSAHNVKRVHHYQRGRASITGFRLWLREIIETERLVEVARRGLCVPSMGAVLKGFKSPV